MRRRLIAGSGVALALFGTLIFAERGSNAPAAPVSTKSIALSRPNIATPTINIPTLPQVSDLLKNVPNLGSNGPSASNFGGFELPIGTTCESLLLEREVLLNTPQTPARDLALTVNALELALFHC
jgi:hypothetical protein